MAFSFGVPPQDFKWPHLATPMKHFWRRPCCEGARHEYNTVFYYHICSKNVQIHELDCECGVEGHRPEKK